MTHRLRDRGSLPVWSQISPPGGWRGQIGQNDPYMPLYMLFESQNNVRLAVRLTVCEIEAHFLFGPRFRHQVADGVKQAKLPIYAIVHGVRVPK